LLLTLLAELPVATGLGTDISAAALQTAALNAASLDVASRATFTLADMLDGIDGPFDLIISNPPYVTTMAMEELPREYRHEPALALAGGDDGLDAVRTILRKAPQFMQRDALLVVEIGDNRAGAETAFPRMPFTWLSTPSSEASVFLLKREEIVAGR